MFVLNRGHIKLHVLIALLCHGSYGAHGSVTTVQETHTVSVLFGCLA
jgi:hypothetical protein